MPDTEIHCSLTRRFGAIIYDTILLFCVVFVAWQPIPLVDLVDLPFIFERLFKLGYLTGVCFLFFAWFWRNGGQTLGMRAWKIKLIPRYGKAEDTVPWGLCWLRFIGAMASWALLGAGFLGCLIHPEKLTWHDLWSRTKLIVIH